MTNKESQTVEYKQNWHDDCLKAISAFANSDGVSQGPTRTKP